MGLEQTIPFKTGLGHISVDPKESDPRCWVLLYHHKPSATYNLSWKSPRGPSGEGNVNPATPFEIDYSTLLSQDVRIKAFCTKRSPTALTWSSSTMCKTTSVTRCRQTHGPSSLRRCGASQTMERNVVLPQCQGHRCPVGCRVSMRSFNHSFEDMWVFRDVARVLVYNDFHLSMYFDFCAILRHYLLFILYNQT